MRFQGEDGFVTRLVCGYNPTVNRKLDSGTTYQQLRRFYIDKQNDVTCPRKRFIDDLVKHLKTWRAAGERLIVCCDTNEHIYDKHLGSLLTKTNGIGMKKVVGSFTGVPVGATFFRGSDPIDGVWAMPDITVTNACIMPVGFGVGDHRLFVVDFTAVSLVGKTPPPIVRPASCRLNTKITGCTQFYVED